jgi:hypothetical protein
MAVTNDPPSDAENPRTEPANAFEAINSNLFQTDIIFYALKLRSAFWMGWG